MIADIAYGAAALCALLLIWTTIERVADWLHERGIKHERERRIATMVEAWRSKDREFMLQQRRIRGEE